MSADAFLAEEGARVADWLGGLLTRGLALPEGLTVDQRSHQMDGARAAAAELAGAHWGHESAGIEARVQAAQFVSAHAAAMEWQAEANRRDLPPHARATAQRLARQLMALTTSQLHALCRLKAEQRKEREQTARLAEQAARLAAHETAAQAKARIADRRALATDLERALKATAEADVAAMTKLVTGPEVDPALDPDLDPELDAALDLETMADLDLDKMAELALAMAAPPPGTNAPVAVPSAPPSADPPTRAKPAPVGAGVPERPAESPMNRRQRRALARLRRKKDGRGG